MNLPQNAGLGAMMQTKGAGGAGITKQSMNEMMAKAQKLPDSELADVLAGKSMQVPQFAAMLAAMGRESLRTAVSGAQAGQAKEPNKKEQMLAKMSPQAQQPMPPQAGLEAIPAPNMETVNAAEGGIIAFSGEDGSYVDPLAGLSGSSPEAVSADQERVSRILAERAAQEEEVRQRFLRQAAPQLAAPTPVPEVEDPRVSPTPVGREPIPPSARPPGVAPRAPGGGAPSAAVQQPQVPERRTSPIDQLLAPTEDIAKQVASSKNQAQGEFMMQIGAALMRTPNAGVALSKGIESGLPGLAANRKEINAIQKDQRDYRLNLSKAQEAAAQGRDDLAFKYADLAEKAQYHAGIIAVSGARAAGGGAKITQAQFNAANKAANDAWKAREKALGARARLVPAAEKEAFINAEFQSQLQRIQTGAASTPVGPQFQEPPSGAVTRP